jgi:sarcosine oxidase subunit gamma
MRSRVLDPCSFIRVQTWDSQAIVSAEIEQTLGTVWPKQVGAVASSRADILCIGPTDWLVTSSDPDPTALFQQLDEAFEGTTFRATNVSQALARVELHGSEVRTLLLKGCSLDLDPSHFPPGRCARTRFASLPVILRCTELATFQCIVTSSYRDYLLSWLTDAAEEFLETVA